MILDSDSSSEQQEETYPKYEGTYYNKDNKTSDLEMSDEDSSFEIEPQPVVQKQSPAKKQMLWQTGK